VKIAVLQETKWFGSEVYNVTGAVVLTSDRPIPVDGESFCRGEDIPIFLMDWVINDARKPAGKSVEAWSPRIVSIDLNEKLHVVCCYALNGLEDSLSNLLYHQN